MAKKISSKDIFTEIDIFKGIRDSAEKTITKMNELQAEVQETATALKKSIGGAKFDSSKAINNVVKATTKANKLAKESIQIDKAKSQATITRTKAMRELETLEQAKNRTEQSNIRLQEQRAKQNERILKQQEKQKKLARDEASAYKKLVKATRDLKNQSKDLGAQLLLLEQSGKKNTKAYRDLSRQYQAVTRSAKQGDQQLKKLDKSVGDNFRNVGNYKDAIRGLGTALSTLGVGVGIGQILRGATGVIVDFDQAQADLSAISGKTKQQLAGLTAQAKALGETSQFTASEITSLQIELAKLGFTTEEIEASTEAVSNFASATGADLASASKVAGSALRAFNLDASEMERVVSTLGVATTKSALSFSSYETALSTIAPVANSFGFSVEDTTALLGQLANAGFDASSSATATRNILLNLADANGDLAQELGRPIKNVEDLAEGLAELDEKGIDLAKALELTDKRSVAAFSTFIQGADDLVEFRDSITDVNDELKAMAKKRLESVQGQFTLLTSKIQGSIIRFAEANGIINIMKQSLAFLTENMDAIVSVTFKLIRALVAQRTAILALNLVEKARLLGLKGIGQAIARNIPFTRAYRMEQIKLTRASKQGANTQRRLGDALKGVGWTIAIGLALEFASAMWDAVTGARELAIEEERRNKQNKLNEAQTRKSTDVVEKQIKTLLEKKEEEFRLNDLLIRQKKIDSKTTKERQKLDKTDLANQKDIVAGIKAEAQALLKKAKADKVNLDQALKNAKNATKQVPNYVYDAKMDKLRKVGTKTISARDPAKIASLTARAGAKPIEIKALDELVAELTKNEEELTLQIKEEVSARDKSNRSNKKATTTIKELNTQYKELNEYLSQQKKLQQELLEIEQDRNLLKLEKAFETELDAQIKNTMLTGEFDASLLNQMIDERLKIETSYLEQRRDARISFMKEEFEREKDDRLTALENERDKLLAQDNMTTEARTEILANFDIRKGELDTQDKLRKADLNKEIQIEEAETQNAILEIRQNALDSYDEIRQEELDSEESFRLSQLDKMRDFYKTANDLVKMSADYFVQQSNRKIEAIDREISEAQKQAETFRTLAENGNIDAKESLAEQQRIIDEANRRKLQEQKRQERLRLAESVFQTYTSKLESDSKNPLAETIRDTSLLLQFINSIPAFEDGTENTGANGKGVDGRGGFHAILHPNERVVPKTLNDKIGALTNEQLTQIAVDYQNGRILDGSKQTQSALDFAVLVNGINELKEVVKNKPETNIELGEITGSLMSIVKSTKQGNSTTYNRYKIKK